MGSPVYITGVAAALPERKLTNEQLVAGMPWLDVSADWVREHTGIAQRHVAAPGEQATDLGGRAAVAALERARCHADAIDLVLLATNTPQFVFPAGAAMIQERLIADSAGRARMARAAALDLQQGCASFVAGIILGAGMIQSGSCRRVLVVGADVATRMLDWTDRNSILLGDGAAACVLADELPEHRAMPALEILASFMRTIPDQDSIFQRSHLDPRNDPFAHMQFAAAIGGRVTRQRLYARMAAPEPAWADTFFHMDGRKVYRFVRRVVTESGYLEVLRRAGLVSAAEVTQLEADAGADTFKTAASAALLSTIGSRIDRFVPHGANLVLDQELADQMHIPNERMAVTLQEHGNTSTASVGIALACTLQGNIRYATIAHRSADGKLVKQPRDVVVEPLRAGHVALLLSFGAGTSWNYVVARAV